MRTTVTFDDDVAAQLEQLRARGSRSFKQLINEAVRVGLAQMERPSSPATGPFTRAVDLGRVRLSNLDDVSEALAIAEGEDHP